jgi:hypothetical protein
MKTHLRYGLLLPLACSAIACSSVKTAQNETAEPTRSLASATRSVTEDTSVEFNASAANPQPVPQTYSIDYRAADLRSGRLTDRKTVEVPIMVAVSQPYQVSVDDYVTRDVYDWYNCTVRKPRTGQVWKYDANRKHPSWQKLATAKTNDAKALYLADAIDGVSVKYARELIDHGFLTSAPNSWDSFEAAIRNAEKAKILLPSHVQGTLVDAGYENHIRLGYYLASNTGYDEVPGRCWGKVGTEKVKVGSHMETRYKTVQQKVASVVRDLTVVINGSFLLPSETESVDMWVSAGNDDVRVTSTDHNRFQGTVRTTNVSTQVLNGITVTNMTTVVTLDAIERVRTQATSRLIEKVDLMDTSSGLQMTLTLDDQLQDLYALGVPGNFTVRYDIESCKPGSNWFSGIFYPCNWKYEKIGAEAELSTSRVQAFQIPNDKLKGAGYKYRVKAQLDFTANKFYQGTTEMVESNKVKKKN